MSFDLIWDLLDPPAEYTPMRNYCQKMWDKLGEDKQQTIYHNIQNKKNNGKFVDFNPLYAIQKNSNPAVEKKQILSFNDYYNLYGTTEPQDGWQQANPTGNKVIYIKN